MERDITQDGVLKVLAAVEPMALQDVFEYIEMFYNPKRKHTNNGMLSTVDFETLSYSPILGQISG